jgi:membrane associated rhomboid family serine protease
MLPLGDDNSARRTTPVVVYGLILVNALVWLLQLSQGDAFTMGFSTVPYEITHGTDLVGVKRIVVDGHAQALRHYPGPTPIYLTLLTSMFMHGGWMHIIGNMVYLFIFGDQIEDRLGRVKFLLFYLVCGIAASLAQVMFHPDSLIPALGASGAIAGVLGAYLVLHPRNRVRVLAFNAILHVPAIIVLGGWIVLQIISQVSVVQGAGGVAYMAHIGGFVAGMILIFLLTRGRPAPAPGRIARTYRS